MRLKVNPAMDGLHPNEMVVQVDGADGPEFVPINRRSFDGATIEIGWPVAANDKGFCLVELPHEAQSGAWRVWVDSQQLLTQKH